MDFERLIRSFFAIQKQNRFDTTDISKAENLVIFIVPPKNSINGGILSIFYLCRVTRELMPDACVLIATEPGMYTYDKNTWFENSENIFRLSQVLSKASSAKSILLHVPEYFAPKLTGSLSRKEKDFLLSLPYLHINILNQNIKQMPSREKIAPLFTLTEHITQTTAHDRYATQEMCNRWGIPLHHFSALLGNPSVNIPSFNEKLKKKILVISKDKNSQKQAVLDMLGKKLPDYRIIVVKRMSYTEYFSLVARAMFVVTFGEGFDGYFIQPPSVGSIGIAVYNENFFPGPHWKKLDNVYSSYDELIERFAEDVRRWEKDEALYRKIMATNQEMLDALYSLEKYRDNLKRFYDRKYDFLPQE